jgi:hypothetical protein
MASVATIRIWYSLSEDPSVQYNDTDAMEVALGGNGGIFFAPGFWSSCKHRAKVSLSTLIIHSNNKMDGWVGIP